MVQSHGRKDLPVIIMTLPLNLKFDLVKEGAILVGEDKNYNLMKNIPILPEEIEDIMNN